MFSLLQLLVAPSFILADWQDGGHGGKWALGCKYNTEPFWETKVKGEHCEMYCDLNYKCDHFYWAPPLNDNVNGTCYMLSGYKEGKTLDVDAPSFDYSCGYFIQEKRRWREGGHNGYWAMGCSFNTPNIAVTKTKCDNCELLCAKSRHRCDHFTCTPPGPKDGGQGLCNLKKGFTMGMEPISVHHDTACGYIDRIN